MALAGFERIHLSPDETGHVTFRLDPRTLSQVDEHGNRAVVPGRYQISLGGSQPDGDVAQGVQSKEFDIVGTEQIPR
jgi:beta-glucosidase